MMKIKVTKLAPEAESDMEDMAEGGEEEGYDDHELECKAKVLLEAEQIKADPKLMAALKPKLAQLAKAGDGIKSLADLREVAEKKMKKKPQ